MDVVLFMCLWLDHYLHQHGGCGPMGATWLGGITTFTTARVSHAKFEISVLSSVRNRGYLGLSDESLEVGFGRTFGV